MPKTSARLNCIENISYFRMINGMFGTVVVVAASDYQKLSRRPKGTLAQFLRSSPLSGVKLDLRRSRDKGRAVPL